MIRILQVGLSQNPGGVENCIINYYRYLDRKNICFDFADIYGEGLAYSSEIMELGGKIYTLSNFKKDPLKMASQFRQILEENLYDIVHINMLSAANLIPITISCRNRNKPIVIAHSHNTNIPSGNLRKILNKVNVIRLRNMQIEKWACSVKAGKWMWGESFNTEDVIPNAIDISRFHRDSMIRERLREECGFEKQDTIVGFVGRLCEQKNVLFLPEILIELRKLSSEYRMLIIGDGPLKIPLMKKFRQFDLLQNIYFTGGVTDASLWYSAMDVFVLPSRFEGLPVVGIEAQANELPCFVSDWVTNELNITNSITYLPIQNGATVWAEAIHKVLKNPLKNLCEFPKEYQIAYAAELLGERYLQLQNRKRR